MDKKRRQSHVQASIKYNAKNTKAVKLSLNLKTDADIIDYLESLNNKQGYIKGLIRADMKKTIK